jgi:hypothetical protein
MKDGTAPKVEPFAKFRASPLFAESRKRYEAGWTTHDRVADPRFVKELTDLRLQKTSPAIDAGQPIPSAWPDPLRDMDKGPPDIGALPHGSEPWGVGIEGRLGLFSGKTKSP